MSLASQFSLFSSRFNAAKPSSKLPSFLIVTGSFVLLCEVSRQL
ncbi:unnamed protein product [Periconia digitata]|uniref:Uncharacterized protein n=1 Tax=Periconia digitata TaxID=1303443 RepID=A0A9W4XWN5_9PLEO|nr:unnamed protein product [Periconia digitata]